MKIRILKGSQEIGGTCIELSHEGRSILLELGMPLAPESKPVDLTGFKPEALIISHPHQDHYGRMEELAQVVPIYIGEIGRRLIDAVRIFRKGEPMSREFRYIDDRKPFKVAGFTITPFLVDHSSPESFAFLVEAGGKRVFYSGDFRSHGKKGKLFDRIVKHPPKDVDVLIMEGTNIGREGSAAKTEEEIGREIFNIIKDQKNISFLVCSGQNIDRLTCAWKACRDARKTMVLDLYTAWILEQMKIKTDGVPSMEWQWMRVLFSGVQPKTVKTHPECFGDFLERAEKRSIDKNKLYKRPEEFLSVIRLSGAKIVEAYRNRLEHPINVIYSQWRGYLEPSHRHMFGAEKMASFRNDPGMNFHYAHTSGHADLGQLKTFAKAINANIVIPVHTEHYENFSFHFDNVMILEDSNWLMV
jgi:ribonuclease J